MWIPDDFTITHPLLLCFSLIFITALIGVCHVGGNEEAMKPLLGAARITQKIEAWDEQEQSVAGMPRFQRRRRKSGEGRHQSLCVC